MLGLGLHLPGGETLVSSNAEVAAVTDDSVRFGPGVSLGLGPGRGDRTEVMIRSDRRVRAPEVRSLGDGLTVALGPVGGGLEVTFG